MTWDSVILGAALTWAVQQVNDGDERDIDFYAAIANDLHDAVLAERLRRDKEQTNE